MIFRLSQAVEPKAVEPSFSFPPIWTHCRIGKSLGQKYLHLPAQVILPNGEWGIWAKKLGKYWSSYQNCSHSCGVRVCDSLL